MNSSFLFLLGNPEQGGSMMSLVFMGAIFLVFYLFIIRPQSKKQKETQEKINNIKKGDTIVTSGGMVVTVTQIYDEAVAAEIDTNVKARFLKTAIVDVNPEKKDKK